MIQETPAHIGIIMDGNGRWAQRHGLPRHVGHKEGAEAVRRTVRAAGERGVEYLSLFGFSAENWRRPDEEVGELMRLLRLYLRAETASLHKNNVRVRIIGQRDEFASDICRLMQHAEDLTQANTGLNLNIALNYGGRQDILYAARAVTRDHAAGLIGDDALSTDFFRSYLLTGHLPDIDLLIRTSGELRLSNFMLWHSAYAELYFTETCWPDFGEAALDAALQEYARRQRRFGGLDTETRHGS